MRLSQETLERHRQRVEERQEELQLNAYPMTVNRAKDFRRECKRCQQACDYCIPATGVNIDHDPLGR